MGDLLFHPAHAPHLRVVEQSPAGRFANITHRPGGPRYAVCIGRMAYCETDSATLAARAATALDELMALGFEPSAPCVESVVRAGLAASLSAVAGDETQPPKGA